MGEEKKQVSKAQIKATTKWESENYEKILVRMPKGKRDTVKEQAKNKGYSLNAYIMALIEADKNGGTLAEKNTETPKADQTENEPPAQIQTDEYMVTLPHEYFERSQKIGVSDFQKFVKNAVDSELIKQDKTGKGHIINGILKEWREKQKQMLAEGKSQQEIDDVFREYQKRMKSLK